MAYTGRMPLIEARGVVKAYGGVRALSGVGIELLAGEVHALCGENGAGKSTLNRILCGAIPPDAGEILQDGQPVEFGSVAEAEAAGRFGVSRQRMSKPARVKFMRGAG